MTSAEQVSQTQVRGWDIAQKKVLIGTAPARATSAELPDANPAGLTHVFGDPTYVATDVPYRKQAEVDVAARAVAEQIAGAFAELDAVTRGNPKIRAGAAVSIDNIGPPFDGKYTVTTSRHHFDQTAGYVTRFAVTGRQERSLLGLASGGGSSYRRLAGVVIAQVSDVNDPQGLGRVKLAYPWLSDTYVSDWARTVQPGAGKDRGTMVVPEVGDEVLAAFELGDIRRPYVVGGLHNGVDTPKSGPVDLVDSGSGEINRRSFVSRSGHRLDFLDQTGKTEGVTIRTGDDKLQLLMDATGTKLTVHSDGTVLVEASQGVTVDAATSTVERRGGDIKLTGKNGVTNRRRCRGRQGHRGQRPQPHRSRGETRRQRAGRGQGRRNLLDLGGTGPDQLTCGQGGAAVPAAARVGDPTGHPGVIGPPASPAPIPQARPVRLAGPGHIAAAGSATITPAAWASNSTVSTWTLRVARPPRKSPVPYSTAAASPSKITMTCTSWPVRPPARPQGSAS